MTDRPEPADETAAASEGQPELNADEASFPASYVRELRAENARRRTNERKLESTLKELASTVGADETEPEELVSRVKRALEQSGQDRALAEEALISSKLSQLTAERDVVDPDAARQLLDMSGVTVDLEARKVEGLDEAMETLLSERPYLRGRSVPGGTPGGGTPRASRPQTDQTLAGRVRREFQRRLPSGMTVPGASLGNMRIS